MKSRQAGIFVTGTDTGVGKTVVAAALLTLSRADGLDAVPMKSVQTGCLRKGGRLVAHDLECCLRMAGLTASTAEKNLMAPYRFARACSPHLAASQAGRCIAISRIVGAFLKLQERHACVIVEGAGGILVPLNERQCMLDLMKILAIPVVLVARPGLGSINHALLSLGVLRQAGLSVAGVIFCATQKRKWGIIERDTMVSIARLGRVRILGRLPFISSWNPRAFRTFCEHHLEIDFRQRYGFKR